MHRSRTLVLVGLSLLAVAARPALAQTADSAAFHRGQWGAEFQAGSSFAGVGALHFSSPTRALFLNLILNYQHSSASDSAFVNNSADYNAVFQIGARAYHQMDRKLYRWTTLGVEGNIDRLTVSADTMSAIQRSFFVGVFGELGATWLVTPHLGLGAKWVASIDYTHTSTSQPGFSSATNYWHLSLGRMLVMGQLYF